MDVRETVREAEAPPGEDEDAYHVAAEYPMTWARLGRPHYVGDEYLVLNAEDCSHNGWQAGDRVVLTAAPTQFANSDKATFTGAPRIWMDHDQNTTARRDNEKALHDHSAHFSNDYTGVEVVTVQAALNRTTFRLMRPLRFDHYVGIERLSNRDQQADVHVGTHAALLTRGIVVRSALSGDGGGCNNLASQVDHPRNGGEGFVVENNEDDIDSPYQNERDISHCMNSPKTTRTLYPPKPSWLHNTSHLVAGCNTLFGAEQKFRYGASVSLDGVEMRQLGTAPNFGRLGTYGVHFHVAGYPRSFTGYLRNSSHTRELRVVSSSIWMSFARYVVVHGTMETLVRNNVGFLAYGSGYFCEDGTELDNVFDHNTGISTLSTIANPYWNPAPVFSFVSTDYSVMSTFWFKNNMNSMSRNLACNSPSPVLGAWYVPQKTHMMRGPSTVCIGSKKLDLPGMSPSYVANAGASSDLHGLDGCDRKKFGAVDGPSSCVANNSDDCRCLSGYLYDPTIHADDERSTAACYVPANFSFRFMNNGQYVSDSCNIYSSDAVSPIYFNVENVFYAMSGFYSEFPEMLRTDHDGYMLGTDTAYAFDSCVYNHTRSQYTPTYCSVLLPRDGWNGCTDAVGQGEYMRTKYVLNAPGRDHMDTPGDNASYMQRCSVQTGSTCQSGSPPADAWYTVPKIFSALLLWRTGAQYNQLFMGAIWTKDTPPWCLGCALLAGANVWNTTRTHVRSFHAELQYQSTQMVYGFDLVSPPRIIPGIYAVYDNLLLKGSLPLPQSTMLFTGDSTLIDETSVLDIAAEGLLDPIDNLHKHPRYAQHVVAHVFDAERAGIASVFVNGSRMHSSMLPATTSTDYTLLDSLQYMDMTTRKFTRSGVTLAYNSTSLSAGNPIVNLLKYKDGADFTCEEQSEECPDTAKYLSICAYSKPRSVALHDNRSIVGNVIGPIFDSVVGRAVGDRVCAGLALVPGMLMPANADGTTYDSKSQTGADCGSNGGGTQCKCFEGVKGTNPCIHHSEVMIW
ncbi:hypothetical protein CYMTET_22508 [Cymbomonas tetramitiformis]|uniref:CEMIP beta-helix domain-containing protein n=1 Tax=Cymbomonas tetramitiformis TaxID=36881 RepID=A0AAE0G098_9CHLO|nr:hypothetical protein CYMTET_22508 [Cymbomonas tetramitiformis]